MATSHSLIASDRIEGSAVVRPELVKELEQFSDS